MIRFGTGILIAAGACAAIAAAACGDNSVGGPPVSAAGGSSSGGASNSGGSGTGATSSGGSSNGGSTGNSSDACMGMCCPTDASCYSSSAGKTAPGAECMARIQNTKKHIQMRQTWIDILSPKGNTIPIVLSTLNTYTQLNEAACYAPMGASGYMQAIDLDLDAGTSTVGYVKYVQDTKSAISDGLCFVDIGKGVDSSGAGWKDVSDYGSEKNFDFSLPADQLGPSDDWPEGLPKPMAQPWKMGPNKSKRLDKDFDLSTEREAILKRLEPTGDLGMAGFDAVFYYDEATGKTHGYSPISFQIIYDAPTSAGAAPTSYILVPAREAELRYQSNSPDAPNCIGKFLPDNLDPSSGCTDPAMYATKPAWGGIFDTKPGESDAHILSYFLITELEQVYSKVLQQTLCVSYPTRQVSQDAGWATMTEARCRKSPHWNPKDPVMGIPKGDWCAKTNGPATDSCHDAYRSDSYHAFQAFKVKTDHCAAL